MKLAKPGEPVEFVPDSESHKPEDARATYIIKVPTHYDRIDLDRAVMVRQGRHHGIADLARAMGRVLARMYAPASPPAEQLEAIEAWEQGQIRFLLRVHRGELATDTPEGLAAFQKAADAAAALDDAIAPLSDLIAAHDERYAAMLADNAQYPRIFATEAARKFVVGWRNAPNGVAFERGPTGVPLELLARLGEAHLAAIAGKVRELMNPSPAEAKNSASPLPGPSTERTSATATTPPRMRRSKTTAGT